MGLAAPALPQDVSAPCRLCEPRRSGAEEKPASAGQPRVEAGLDFDRLIIAGAGDGSAELDAGRHAQRQRLDQRDQRPGDGRRGGDSRRARPAGSDRPSRADRTCTASAAARSASNRSAPTCRAAAARFATAGSSFRFGGVLQLVGRRRRRFSRRRADQRRISLSARESLRNGAMLNGPVTMSLSKAVSGQG